MTNKEIISHRFDSWLQEIRNSPLGAEAAAQLTNTADQRFYLNKKQLAVQRINQACTTGDIDKQYIQSTGLTPTRFLMEVMTLDEHMPLIMRSRTLQEIMHQFPQELNEDNTRNVPIGVSAEVLNPALLYLNERSPLVIAANSFQQLNFIQTIEQVNKILNAKMVPVFQNPTGAQLDKLWNTSHRKSLIIAQMDSVPANDREKIIRLSKEIPYHHVVLLFSPKNHPSLSPDLRQGSFLVYSSDIYFTKIEPNRTQQKYFPVRL